MPETAFGPQGPNYTTTRPPADPKASAGVDTWFKNCSAAGAKDGTFATADFFNVLIGNLRYLVRTETVPLDDADNTMVWEAVRRMIVRLLDINLWTQLRANKGVKINAADKYIQLRLGDGTLPVLT